MSTVGRNEARNIKEQEKHDIELEKLSVKEYEDFCKDSRQNKYPFKGGKKDKGDK